MELNNNKFIKCLTDRDDHNMAKFNSKIYINKDNIHNNLKANLTNNNNLFKNKIKEFKLKKSKEHVNYFNNIEAKIDMISNEYKNTLKYERNNTTNIFNKLIINNKSKKSYDFNKFNNFNITRYSEYKFPKKLISKNSHSNINVKSNIKKNQFSFEEVINSKKYTKEINPMAMLNYNKIIINKNKHSNKVEEEKSIDYNNCFQNNNKLKDLKCFILGKSNNIIQQNKSSILKKDDDKIKTNNYISGIDSYCNPFTKDSKKIAIIDTDNIAKDVLQTDNFSLRNPCNKISNITFGNNNNLSNDKNVYICSKKTLFDNKFNSNEELELINNNVLDSSEENNNNKYNLKSALKNSNYKLFNDLNSTKYMSSLSSLKNTTNFEYISSNNNNNNQFNELIQSLSILKNTKETNEQNKENFKLYKHNYKCILSNNNKQLINKTKQKGPKDLKELLNIIISPKKNYNKKYISEKLNMLISKNKSNRKIIESKSQLNISNLYKFNNNNCFDKILNNKQNSLILKNKNTSYKENVSKLIIKQAFESYKFNSKNNNNQLTMKNEHNGLNYLDYFVNN